MQVNLEYQLIKLTACLGPNSEKLKSDDSGVELEEPFKALPNC